MTTTGKAEIQALIRILIADDEATIRDSYRDILKTRSTPPAKGLDEMRVRLFGSHLPGAAPSAST